MLFLGQHGWRQIQHEGSPRQMGTGVNKKKMCTGVFHLFSCVKVEFSPGKTIQSRACSLFVFFRSAVIAPHLRRPFIHSHGSDCTARWKESSSRAYFSCTRRFCFRSWKAALTCSEHPPWARARQVIVMWTKERRGSRNKKRMRATKNKRDELMETRLNTLFFPRPQAV